MKKQPTPSTDDFLAYVRLTLAMEDLYPTKEDWQSMRDCLDGKLDFNAVIPQLVERFKVKEIGVRN